VQPIGITSVFRVVTRTCQETAARATDRRSFLLFARSSRSDAVSGSRLARDVFEQGQDFTRLDELRHDYGDPPFGIASRFDAAAPGLVPLGGIVNVVFEPGNDTLQVAERKLVAISSRLN
jgi:hypothetical protein